jgi:hypothetical protein
MQQNTSHLKFIDNSSLVPGLPSAGELQAVVNLRAVSFGKYPNWVALEGLAKFAIINMAVYFRIEL